MKTRSLLLGIVALFGTAGLYAQEAARAPLHIGINAIYASPSWEDVNDGYGAGVAFGATVKDRHIIEGELMYLKFDTDDYKESGVTISGDITILPVLATYRYYIPFGQSAWGLEAGGSVGMSMVKYEISASGAGNGSWSDTAWAATLGGQANFVYKFNKTSSFQAGLRALWTAETDFEFNVRGYKIKETADSGTMIMATVGFKFSF